MEISDIVAIIRDVIVAGAAVATVCIAKKGLESWRAELKGRTSFEAARTITIAMYRLRNALSYCRSPLISSGEFPEDYDDRKGSSEDRAKAYAHVYENRWKPVGEALESFNSALLEAEALWGEKVKLAGLELRQCVHTLRLHIKSYIRNEYSDGKHFRQNRKREEKVESSLFEDNPKKNELSQRIAKAVEGIENEIKPHLAGS